MLSVTLLVAISPFLLGTFALQKPLHQTDCCKVLQEAGIKHVLLPGNATYSKRVQSYWSLTSQLTPSCFVQPENTEEVSAIVKSLVEKTKCEFSIRSGGHSSNACANNIEEGVTIDFGRMNGTSYDSATKIASIQPAARWLRVYRTFDALDRGIQGGGIGSVGAGGLLLGGGFANYLYQRGLATDDIVNFEVVLANGSVVQANATSNKDLWRTLKGGGSGFGVVTRYDMETFDRLPIWSASRQYNSSAETDEAHILGLKHWTDNPDALPSNYAYIWWTYRPAISQTIIIAEMGDTKSQANPPAVQEFLAIPDYISSNTGLTNMSTSAQATQAEGYRNIWFTVTFKNDERVIRKAVDLHRRLVEDMKRDSSDGDFETQAYFQPLPSIVGQRGAEKGGNTLGIDKLKDNAIVLLGSLAVNGIDQEAMGRQKMLAWRRTLEKYSDDVGAAVDYRYMNYADASQDVLASYGEDNLKTMLEVSRKYDPEGVFQTRAPGGYKLPWDYRKSPAGF
ncbi:hypothetical protein M409DRAFT_64021 [Zasmidium cellare ATCC 36951]|uniref:FAD-binding PCMH-type domain-containing protein n=1 Tax=Zasmidium cellare ATCC 36951 TaxID=1080233 RepID=A0A6A6CXU4_ZASCE|nr:uncharacterized protein M409DRAFT_64021 [Zasmidium cellare ATCC 36951]KAF2171038.1 hypothetical protein M409DRAFT_64021 [Zasmidium cellare ATCC 36951]